MLAVKYFSQNSVLKKLIFNHNSFDKCMKSFCTSNVSFADTAQTQASSSTSSPKNASSVSPNMKDEGEQFRYLLRNSNFINVSIKIQYAIVINDVVLNTRLIYRWGIQNIKQQQEKFFTSLKMIYIQISAGNFIAFVQDHRKVAGKIISFMLYFVNIIIYIIYLLVAYMFVEPRYY